MSSFWPSPAEAAMLRFVLPIASLRARLAAAGAFFVAGLAVWSLAPWPLAALGLVPALAGHLFVWARRQTTAPGGATPLHEEIWAPTEDEWMERIDELESRGERWDASPWDLTSGRGCLTLIALGILATAGSILLATALGPDAGVRAAGAAAVLFVPLWLNGIRTTWNPSELRKKGKALAVARQAAAALAGDDYDEVPLLALRQGRRGKYPVDARLMLRPKADDGSGFLGIQIQVAMNSVQGTDYPYLYCVILGRDGFEIPSPDRQGWRDKVRTRITFAPGADKEVTFLVVRQHADRRGGWHTEPKHIRDLVEVAVEEARRAWEANRKGDGS